MARHSANASRAETLAFTGVATIVVALAAVLSVVEIRAIEAAPGVQTYASPTATPFLELVPIDPGYGGFLSVGPPDPAIGIGVRAPVSAAPAGGSGPAGVDNSATTTEASLGDQELAEAIRQNEAWRRKLAKRAEAAVRASEQLPAFSFRVGSFNVLGASHTVKGGSHRGFADGVSRMGLTVSAVRSRALDVVGFQEMEQPQWETFNRLAPEYTTYPGMLAGNKSVRFNLAWRTELWEVVSAELLDVPYAGGSIIGMPVVLLKSRETGRMVWFANFHNPADTPSLGNNGHWREVGSSIELDYLTKLREQSDYPVIVTGDFNDRAGIFCKFTSGILSQAAAGGSNSGVCLPPYRMQVDWIFGTSDVSFSGYAVDSGSPIGQASDHEMVHSTVTLLEKVATP